MTDKEMITALILIIASLLEETDRPFRMDGLLKKLDRYDNNEWIDLIDRWVRSARGRSVLKRRLVDKETVEHIGEEIDRTREQTTRIIKQACSELYKHI